MSEKLCAVVLLWYGKPRLAMRAMQSIADHCELENPHVFCYDNGSEAAHNRTVCANFPQFNHFRGEQNTGYAGGFNQSLRSVFAKGYESALFLTSDTEITPGALPACLKSAHEHQANLVAPQVCFRRPSNPLDAWGGCFDPRSCQLRHYRKEPQPSRLQPPWDYIPGTALWLRRSAFNRLEGVNESFFMYWEDVDLCVRAHQAGMSLVRSPARILHGGGETCAKKPLYTAFYFQRNRLRFCRLHLAGEERRKARSLLTRELDELAAKWTVAGDPCRRPFIEPLQAELSLW